MPTFRNDRAGKIFLLLPTPPLITLLHPSPPFSSLRPVAALLPNSSPSHVPSILFSPFALPLSIPIPYSLNPAK